MTGTLYLCATPIGNLGDITQRVLDTLREADVIAAEDTRNSLHLLNHFDIHTPMTSYHEYNNRPDHGCRDPGDLGSGRSAGTAVSRGADPGDIPAGACGVYHGADFVRTADQTVLF